MANSLRHKPTVSGYLQDVLIPAINRWWTLITGLVGLIAWVIIPGDIVSISKYWFLFIAVVTSFCFISFLSVLFRGWIIYKEKSDSIQISEIIKHENSRVFILDSIRDVKVGSVFEVYRLQESIETPIGYIEAAHQRQDGMIQAHPLWIMPIHLRDLETGQLSVQNLFLQRTPSQQTLRRWVDEQTEQKLQELLQRGGVK